MHDQQVELYGVAGALPASLEDGKRAHFSLPQPLHFRAVFVGLDGRTASLRMEQVNICCPLTVCSFCEDSNILLRGILLLN